MTSPKMRIAPAGKPYYDLPIDDLRPEAEKPQWDTYKPTKPATSGRVWAEPGASGETPLTDTRLSDPPPGFLWVEVGYSTYGLPGDHQIEVLG